MLLSSSTFIWLIRSLHTSTSRHEIYIIIIIIQFICQENLSDLLIISHFSDLKLKKKANKKEEKHSYPQIPQGVENYYSHVQNKSVETVENS